MDQVRKKQPKAEFLLIASMKFDPAYTSDPTYVGHLASYPKVLRSLVGPGVAMLDMTELSDHLYQTKKAKDFVTDPMHPNDFLARWYAQSLVAMLDNRPKGRTFYLSSKGEDGATGLSSDHAWKSLARIGKEKLGPGDQIVLAGGETFEGSIELGHDVAGTAAQPIVIRSEGKPATIVSPTAPAIQAFHGGIEIRNLILRGEAEAKRDHHNGISLVAEGTEPQRHVRIEDVEVSGFGACGIYVYADKDSLNGFQDLQIARCRAHDNREAGILVGDDMSWRSKGYAHRDLRIVDCEASENHSGSGMVLSGVDGALVEFCRATANEGSGGGVGLWAWSAKKVTFRYCIARGTKSEGGDGGGFDLDGGCVDCVVEHCLAYDNSGPGYMHCDYPSAPPTHRNSIRTSVSLDDGRKAKGDNIGFGFVTWGSGLDDCVIERNLAILTKADPERRENGIYFVTFIEGSKGAADVLHVRDGIFRRNVAVVSAPGSSFVQNGLETPSLTDVLFSENDYRSSLSLPFRESTHRYATLAEWQAASGQEKGRPTPRRLPVKDLRVLNPRDLPNLFKGF